MILNNFFDVSRINKIVIGWIVNWFFNINGEIKCFFIVCFIVKMISILMIMNGFVIIVKKMVGIIVKNEFKYGIRFKNFVMIFNVIVYFRLMIVKLIINMIVIVKVIVSCFFIYEEIWLFILFSIFNVGFCMCVGKNLMK